MFLSSRSTIELALWQPGEPNSNDERCIDWFHGGALWNDWVCNGKHTANVCEMPLV